MNKHIETLVGIISMLALIAHTTLLGIFLYAGILIKLIMPTNSMKQWINPYIEFISSMWLEGFLWWINWVYQPKWHVDGLERVDPNDWYLLTANHQSWVDIFVLYQLYHKKAPFLKFFIKNELKYVPIVGQAWWALDFPFMKRYSKEFLQKHPEKAGEDIKETQEACQKFSMVPTSVMNFLEGTRYEDHKHRQQNSPFRYLLKPKTGGIAFTIQALGDKFSALTNVTIVYPDHVPTFWDMMCGRFRNILIHVQEDPIPSHFAQGDYQNDPEIRQEIQQWVTKLWESKDQRIHTMQVEYFRKLQAQHSSEIS